MNARRPPRRAACAAGLALLAALGSGGCRSAGRPEAPARRADADASSLAAPGPQPSTVEFARRDLGLRLSYPATWVETKTPGFVLRAGPGAASPPGAFAISVDVPDLPPHIPGLIPLGLVVNGYVDDVKRQHAGAEVMVLGDATVAGARARRVYASWMPSGWHGTQPADRRVEEAVLTVHGDRVYIFRLETNRAGYPAARAALDAVVGTVRWAD